VTRRLRSPPRALAPGLVAALGIGTACDFLGDVGGGALGTSAKIPLPDLSVPPLADELTRAVLDEDRIRALLLDLGADPSLVDIEIDETTSARWPLAVAEQLGVPSSQIAAHLQAWALDALDDVEADLNRELQQSVPSGVRADLAVASLVPLELPMPRDAPLEAAWRDHLRTQPFELRLELQIDDVEAVGLTGGLRISVADLERALETVEVRRLELRAGPNPPDERDGAVEEPGKARIGPRSRAARPADAVRSGAGREKAAGPPTDRCGVERPRLTWLRAVDAAVRLGAVGVASAPPGVRLSYRSGAPDAVGCRADVEPPRPFDVLSALDGGVGLEVAVVFWAPARRMRLEGDAVVRVFTKPRPLGETVSDVLRLFAD